MSAVYNAAVTSVPISATINTSCIPNTVPFLGNFPPNPVRPSVSFASPYDSFPKSASLSANLNPTYTYVSAQPTTYHHPSYGTISLIPMLMLITTSFRPILHHKHILILLLNPIHYNLNFSLILLLLYILLQWGAANLSIILHLSFHLKCSIM